VNVSEGKFCLFGGANNDSGPLGDIFLIEVTEGVEGLWNAKFKTVKLEGSIPPLEMHTMEKYNNLLLVIGGRSFDF